MAPRVLLLDNALHRHLFKPPWHWKTYFGQTEVDVVNVPSGRPIPALDAYTHVLLSGSEASILHPQDWFETEARAVREAASRGLALLGSCFGHQMLVYALSGPEYLRRSEHPEIGWITLEMRGEDLLFREVPNPWHVFSYHLDEVDAPPTPWRVLGRSADCPVHVIRHGDDPIWGIQAHPELSLWKVRLFLTVYPLFAGRARRRIASAMRRPTHENRAAGTIVRCFLAAGPNRPPTEEAGTPGR